MIAGNACITKKSAISNKSVTSFNTNTKTTLSK